MAHILLSQPVAQTEPPSLKKKILKKFSSFTVPFTFCLWSQTRSGLKQNKKYKKKQRLGFGGPEGGKFKFVIRHVQVHIKMLQLNSYNSLVNKTGSWQAKFPLCFTK